MVTQVHIKTHLFAVDALKAFAPKILKFLDIIMIPQTGGKVKKTRAYRPILDSIKILKIGHKTHDKT